MTLDETIEAFRAAANAMARGDASQVRELYARSDDVTLANPFGHAVVGFAAVSDALDYVAARFSDGAVTDFDNLARYESEDLATFVDVEHWQTRVGGGDLSKFELRVSSTYRRQDDSWKLVHRHADPISTFDEAGPVRGRS